ncbi:hypothetical protein U0035_15795 [Niabella yanshanensis]|uniref:Uncharacterized protein n=1 Tax=Niabella yanshanensis TaxID=577386 RepID=A0ABZ0W1I7_9BACT|nr:hypothetical protein [Niabella yanshanensis]WQD37133.1 hypothetical protein U0035_15795 [Niabella yanshanensis]
MELPLNNVEIKPASYHSTANNKHINIAYGLSPPSLPVETLTRAMLRFVSPQTSWIHLIQ